MLVPDGVASVTIHYPAEAASGFSHEIVPAFTTTIKVVNNVIAVLVPRAAFRAIGGAGSMVWHAANGSVVKTFNHP
jgi:hypothetical protein